MTNDSNNDPLGFLKSVPAAQKTYDMVAENNPDDIADANRISKTTGKPADFVFANLPVAKRATVYSPEFWAGIESNNPTLAKWAAIPKNMAIAHDDLDNLANIEKVTQAHGIVDAFVSGLESSSSGLLLCHKMPGIAVNEDSFSQKLSAMAGGLTGDLPAMTIGGFVAGIPSIATGPVAPYVAMAGAFALPTAIRQMMIEHLQSGDISSTEELMRRVYSIGKETLKSAALGGLTAGGGALGAKLVSGTAIKGAGFTMKAPISVAKMTAAHATGEITAMTVGGAALEGKMPTGEDFILNAMTDIALRGSSIARDKIRNIRHDTMRAENAKALIINLGEAASASKLGTRVEDEFKGLVDKQIGPALVNIEKFNALFQSKGMEPVKVAQELGISESYKEAFTNGGNVEIPMGTMVGKVMEPFRADLANDVKMSVDQPSINELKEQHTERLEMVKELAGEYKKAIKANPELQTSHDFMVKDFIEDVGPAMVGVRGKGAKSSVQHAAEVNAAFTITEAGKRGLDPIAFYNERKASFFGPKQGAVSGGELFQGARTPEFIEWFGKSTVVDENGEPLTVYHGSPNEFTQFDISKIGTLGTSEGKGFYFSDNPNRAKGYATESGKVYKVHLAIEKPMTLTQRTITDSQLRKIFIELLKNNPDALSNYGDISFEGKESVLKEAVNIEKESETDVDVMASMITGGTSTHEEIAKAFKKITGYDGVVAEWKDTVSPEGKKIKTERVYVAFQPNQIKDVSNIKPTSVPDILFQSPAESFGEKGEQIPSFKKLEWTEPDTSKFETIHGNLRQGKFAPNSEFTIWKIQGGEDIGKYRLQFGGHDVASTPYSDFLPNKYKNFYGETFDTIEAAKSRAETLQKIVFKNVTQEKDRIIFERYKKTGSYYSSVESGEIRISDHPFGVKAEKDAESNVVISGGYLGNLKEDYVKKNINGVDFYYRGDGGKHDFVFPDGYALRNFRKIEKTPEILTLLKSEPDNNLLFQTEKEPLASYSKTKQGAVIKLFKGANASSLLHELSHHWLDNIHDYVKSGKANESYLSDWKITQDYLGHETGKELTREQHEKFAQSFEKYIMEGKAPSVELQTTFEKLKSWMMKVYDGVKNKLGIEITTEIRGVFDRMLATKEAIEQARTEIGLAEENALGLTDEALKARQMAEAMLLKPLMDEMSQSNQIELVGKRVLAETNAKTAIEQEPLYVAIDGIRKANGHETEVPVRADAQKFIDNALSEERANNFEVMAELNGFSSGSELAQKILISDTKEAAVSKMIEAEMKPFERLNDKEALKEDALKALHTGDNMGQLLALEGQVLEGIRLNKEVNAELSAQRSANASREWESVKATVAETLGNKNVKEAGKFRTYYTLERKAAERYGKAMAKGDTEAAIKAKREQLVSHALAAEAVRISDNTDKVLRQVHKIALKDKTLFKEEKNFNQVADLLAKYGFYNRRDYIPASKVETLKGWADRVGNTMSLLNEDGSIIDGSSLVTIPEWILTDSKVLPYGKLTVNEFLDITDTIKHIVHIGNIQDNAFKVGDGKAIRIIVEDLIAQGSRVMPADRPREVEPGRFAKADRWANDYMGGIKRMDTMVWELDGMKDSGPWRDYFIKTQHKQANYESNKRFEMKQGMETLWKAYDKKELKAMFEKKVFYDEIGKSMTRQRLIAMALNIGAKENRTKLFENVPYGMEGAANWNEQTVMAMLQKHLTKKDWQFIQGTWDLIGKLWPYTVTLSEEMTGFKPSKVESIAFSVIADGETINLPGGYYPLRADPRASALAAQREVSTAPLYTDLNPAWKQGVRHGHTEKRTNAQYAVALDLTTIDRHLSEVTHDLAFRALCHDFNRILNNKDMQGFLRNKMGDSGLNFFRNYAASIAAGGNAEKLAQDGMSSIVRDLNSRISTAVILGRVSVMTQNLANPFLAVNAVEGFTAYDVAKGMLSKGLGNYWVKATTNWKAQKAMQEQVWSLSSFMRDKHIRPDYSISDMKDTSLNNFLGGLIAGSDDLTNIPLWLEAYEKKMNQNGKSDEAVAYADLLVNRISGSGRKYDQARMTRGSDIERLVTKFYSFWNIEYQNWIRNVKSEVVNPIANTPSFLGFVASRAMFSYLSAILVGKGPFGDDEDENKKFWISPLRDPVQFFPGARDIVTVGIDQALGLKSYGYRVAPVAGAMENLLRLGPKIKKGEPSAIAESAMKAMSIGIPGITPAYPDQFNVWFWNAYDYAVNDMEPQISDITKRRPVRER